MENFDDLLTPQQPEAPSPQEQSFDKEAWAAHKKQQREDAYALADDTAMSVTADPARFIQYLDVQARFDRLSATNALLVLAQKPEATQLGDLDFWKKQRIFIKPGEMGNTINILAQGRDYHREDGSVGTGVDVKRVYDISQAERPRLQPQHRYNDRTLIRVLVSASPSTVQGVDDMRGLDAEYSPADKTIYVQFGMEGKDTFQAIAREACLIQIGDVDLSFDARAGAYLLCKKFGIDVQGIDLSDVQERFGGMEDAKDVRTTMSRIRDAAAAIIKEMNKEIEPPKQEART